MPTKERARNAPAEGMSRGARTFITAVAISALGNSMYIGAAALLVLGLTRNASSVPLIAVCGGLPPILLASLVPRAIARFGAGSVAITADVICALAASGYPVLHLFSLHPGPWIVYAQEGAIASASTFYSTAARILVTGLSTSSSSVLVRINGYSIATTQVASMVGWGLGAFTFAFSNAATAMSVNVVSFLVSAVMQWRVRDELRVVTRPEGDRVTPAPAGRRWRLRQPPGVLTLAGVIVVFTTTQRLWLSNYPAVLELVLGKPDWSLGVANVAYSVGAILAGVFIAGKVGKPTVRSTVAVICVFYALCVAVTFTSPLMAMLGLYCLVGIASIGSVLAQSRLQLTLPLTAQPAFFARLLAVQNAGNLVFLGLWIALLKFSDPRTLIVATLIVALALTAILGTVNNDRSDIDVGQ